MLSPLPPELLDLIVDYLRDEPIALKACCLVSKLWIHRTRRLLFAHVEFLDRVATPIESWMGLFPEPFDSPAHFARSLSIRGFESVTTAVTHARTWVHPFCHLVHLGVTTDDAAADDDHVSLAQLQRLSPTLTPLSLIRCHTLLSDIFDLICSFPLLEDLRLIRFGPDGGYGDINGWNTTTSPKFTGSLHLTGEVGSITLGLLNLPGGLHFSKIEVSCPDCHAE